MPGIPSGQGEVGRWERARTIALLTSAAVALLVGVAAGVSFVVSHFATSTDIDGLKEVQNRIIACIEHYAIPLHDLQLKQLNHYGQYLNAKANFIALQIQTDASSRRFWWLDDVANDTGQGSLATDPVRTRADENYGAVLALNDVIIESRETFNEHCNQLNGREDNGTYRPSGYDLCCCMPRLDAGSMGIRGRLCRKREMEQMTSYPPEVA